MPIVLAGRVAAEASPVGARLRELIAGRFAGPIRSARDGVGGAAWLALGEVDPGTAGEAARRRLGLTWKADPPDAS
jgi:hypothetical protein